MAEDIVERVKAAGVVGAGGAGFPTHVKLAAKVDTIIANGAECEPLLHCDKQLITAHADKVVEGLRLEMAATGAQRGFLAVKSEYQDVVSALQRQLAKVRPPGIEVFEIAESTYPAGDEFVLVYEVTGRLIPETGLPLHVGCVVQNVATLTNVAAAVNHQEPVTERYLTVTGEVSEPKTIRAVIGSSFGDALVRAGCVTLPEGEYTVVVGGPMMGRLASSLDEPITKTTSGLIVLPVDNAVVRYMSRPIDRWIKRGQSTCDQCRTCTTLCPRNLLGHDFAPHEIMRAVAYETPEASDVITAAVMCCECRLCEAYACPLELSPCAFYKSVKKQLAASGWKNDRHKRSDLTPHPFREGRRVPIDRLVERLGLPKYHHMHVAFEDEVVLPARVAILLKQHTGAPSVPVVTAGQRVDKGDLIAAIPEGKLGANIHASMGGRVTEITDKSITIQK
jgi:Na+-translocating ferredoxin:NAD+ oxidoreductase RnfC subunit